MPMSPVVDNETYLLKLLTLLIRRSGGEIRVTAAELSGNDFGQGFTRYWDEDKKELVLRFAPQGSTMFAIKEDATWQGTRIERGPRSLSPQAPLTTEQLLALEWARTHGTTVAGMDSPSETPVQPSDSRQPPQQRRSNVILTDEYQAGIEQQRAEKRAMDQILNFQTPSPERQRPAHQGERIAFSQPSPRVKVPRY